MNFCTPAHGQLTPWLQYAEFLKFVFDLWTNIYYCISSTLFEIYIMNTDATSLKFEKFYSKLLCLRLSCNGIGKTTLWSITIMRRHKQEEVRVDQKKYEGAGQKRLGSTQNMRRCRQKKLGLRKNLAKKCEGAAIGAIREQALNVRI